MSKVIRLNERQLNTLISESVKRILHEDEEIGLGAELSQNDRWADYDRAEQEHIDNIKTDYPERFSAPEGYSNRKGADYSQELSWDNEDFDPTNSYNPYDTEGNFDNMLDSDSEDYDILSDEDTLPEDDFEYDFQDDSVRDYSPEMEDELDSTINEAIRRVARKQFRNRRKS